MFTADQVGGIARWPVVRVAAHGETHVVLLSNKFLPLTVHWVGRSVVCSRDGCELCQVLPGRGLFYLAVMCNDRPSILELASLSSSLLEQHCKLLHGGLVPGLVIRLYRRAAKQPVCSEVVDKRSGVASVPSVLLASRVMALYHFPGSNPDEGIEEYSSRLQRMTSIRTSTERKRWDASNFQSVRGRTD